MESMSPKTSWMNQEYFPEISVTAFVAESATVTGPVQVNEYVLISPGASVRGDEGGRIYIGNKTNVQDNVIIHGLRAKSVKVNGEDYSVYISEHVSCGHACIIHGPSFVGRNTFIGFGTIIHFASIGHNCYVGHGARVIGVTIPDGKYVPHGMLVNSPQAVEDLPNVGDKANEIIRFNYEVVEVNVELAKGYKSHERQSNRRGA